MGKRALFVTNENKSITTAAQLLRNKVVLEDEIYFVSSIELFDALEEFAEEEEKYTEIIVSHIYPPHFHNHARAWWKIKGTKNLQKILKINPDLKIYFLWNESYNFTPPSSIPESRIVFTQKDDEIRKLFETRRNFTFSDFKLLDRFKTFYLISRDEKFFVEGIKALARSQENFKKYASSTGFGKLDPDMVELCFLDAKDTPAIKEVREILIKSLETDAPIMIYGETGTGKECVARSIHLLHVAFTGKRRSKFVPINCAAFTDQLFLSELFGYKKGAFTGATNDTPGLLDEVQDGTLFLDEIDKLSINNQARLLRVIDNREYRPVGGGANDTREFLARLITSINTSPFEESGEKMQFRGFKTGDFGLLRDLYYRLSTIKIYLPPVREWVKSDRMRLIHQMIYRLSDGKYTISYLDKGDFEALMNYHWAYGNVREVINTIQMWLLTGKVVFEENFWRGGSQFTSASTRGKEIPITRDVKLVINGEDLFMVDFPTLDEFKFNLVDYLYHHMKLSKEAIRKLMGSSRGSIDNWLKREG